MHSVTHRVRAFLITPLLALLALALITRPAHSAWNADPVQVRATTALCPLVAASDDAHYGAIVVWQENTPSGGLLKAQHVLANGDMDPAWGAAAVVSSHDVARVALGAVPDAAGGSYVWWMEGGDLFLNHVSSSGSIAAGWNAGGRNLGTLPGERFRPVVLPDGVGGVYVGWLSPILFQTVSECDIRLVRLGPSGLGVAGWPTGGRTFVAPEAAGPTVASFALDRTADGGLWIAYGTKRRGISPYWVPGVLVAERLNAAGLPATGWTADGVILGDYDGLDGFGAVQVAMVGVVTGGDGGAFVLESQSVGPDAQTLLQSTLRRLDADGGTPVGWTPGGLDLGQVSGDLASELNISASVRMFTDRLGGAYAGLPQFASENSNTMAFGRWTASGAPADGGVVADQNGLEFAPRGDGGMFIASFKPSGATGPFEADAYIRVSQSTPGASFLESKGSFSATRYGDIGLAATGDGGAIFAWSQLIDRQGVFAVRLNPGGVVTSVPPPAPILGPPSLRLRFVPGVGVRALIASVPSGREELSLHDVSGRVVARASIEHAAGGDWVFPDTEGLPNGVYFARTVSGGVVLKARVAVVR